MSLLGCQSPKVSPEEFVGTWAVSQESRRRLSASPPRLTFPPRAAMSLTLSADRTFSASELPGEFLFVGPGDREKLLSGSGVWKLAIEGGETRVQLEFRAIALGGSQGKVPYLAPPLIVGGGRPPTLFFFHDEDAGSRTTFEKLR
jgi:hypothetical protein